MYSKLSIIRLSIIFSVSVAILSSCGGSLSSKNGFIPKDGETSKFKDSELYNFSHPYLINLPASLDEISGIAYYPKDSSVFAIIDEEALLYKISLNNPENIVAWPFGKASDYEDIILKDSTFYILVSNGGIRSVNFNGQDITTKKFEFILGTGKKKNEFESMYLDSGMIVLLCKDCEEDKKVKTSRFSFNISSGQYLELEPVNNDGVAKLVEVKKLALNASAAAINPLNNDLYVISAINKTLYIFDRTGTPKEFYELNPKVYKQPEGMAFTPDGDLIISNEVYLEGNPNLLVLKNKKK